MTITPDTAPTAAAPSGPRPPYSRLVHVSAGICLVLAGLLNGLPAVRRAADDRRPGLLGADRVGAGHEALHRTEQTLILVAVLVVLWGMWGFHNVLAMGHVAGTVAPTVLPLADAVTLNDDGLIGDPGVLVTALLPSCSVPSPACCC